LFASRQGRRTGIRNRINFGPAPFRGAKTFPAPALRSGAG